MKALKSFLIIAILSTVSIANAQVDSYFNVGVSSSGNSIPIYLNIEVPANQDVTWGIGANFRSFKEYDRRTYNLPTEYQHTAFGIYGLANYNFDKLLGVISDFDLYAGVTVGYYIYTTSLLTNLPEDQYEYVGNYGNGVDVGIQIGGRYHIKDNVALNLEIGGGIQLSSARFGLSFQI